MTKGIKNLDKVVIENKDEQIKALQNAFESTDAKNVATKIVENYENNLLKFQDMMNTTIREANRANEQNWDASVLANRGVRTLTTDETNFYNKAIEEKSFDQVASLVPATVFERVFEDLAVDHSLLSKINIQKTGTFNTTWVIKKEGQSTAYWGEVCANIEEITDGGFITVDQGMNKLSGFLVVCKAMFEIGPEWLDRYVREFLSNLIASELEVAVVAGDGNKKPIGMIRDLDGAVTGGVYSEKESEELKDLTPKTIGEKILAPFTILEKDGEGNVTKSRPYTGITFIVNPYDYALRFFGLGAKQRDDGTWEFDKYPVPGLDIIQTAAVPVGKLVVGNPKDYFLGVASDAKLESSDVVRMIEDQRLYVVRQLATGLPVGNDKFKVYDIKGLGATGGVELP